MFSLVVTEILGWVVLVALAATIALAARRQIDRLQLTVPQSLLYGFNYLMARILWRARVEGRLRLPPGQGAVIVSNHRCPADPSFLHLTTSQVVHWMVAKEYCVHPALRWFFRTVEAIPVSRGGIDTKATKIAIRYVEQGGLVGMFPEGRINTAEQLLMPGRPGAALIALRARVPIVPMYVEGSPYDGSVYGCLFMPAKVRLTIGEPIDLSAHYEAAGDRQTQRAVTLMLLREIAKLAGRPDFEPSLAGRNYREPNSHLRSETE